MELSDYKSQVNQKTRSIDVEVECNYCHQMYWVKWSKEKRGLARFCSRNCSSQYRKESLPSYVGKDNVNRYWDKAKQVWCVYWYDLGGERHNSTLARWMWEQAGRSIPPKHVIYYKDNNPENCVLDNLVLVSRTSFNSDILLGHEVSDDTRRKISEKALDRWNKGMYDSSRVGENHPSWRGGIEKGHPKEFNGRLKSFIKGRDNYTCRICGQSDSRHKSRLEVHHIDRDRNNNEYENLITTCSTCHHRIHGAMSDTDPVILAFRTLLT